MTTTTMRFEVTPGDVDTAWQAVDRATTALVTCGLTDRGAYVTETLDNDGVAGEIEINQWGAGATRRAFKQLLEAQMPRNGCVQVTGECAGQEIRVR
jgi:hypothetical protein